MNWQELVEQLFGKGGQPLDQAVGDARSRFAEGAQPYTDLFTAPFSELPPERKERLYETMASMIGPQTGIFAGVKAKTANHVMLEAAKKLEKAGADADGIWKATGWGRGKDGKWRFEIDDSASQFMPGAADAMDAWVPKGGGLYGPATLRAKDVYSHPELYAAYPELGNINMTYPPPGYLGSSWGGKIGIDPRHYNANSTMLHELQHEVQGIERFARGSNTSTVHEQVIDALKMKKAPHNSKRIHKIDADKLYRHQAGETEARSVQKREWMRELERAKSTPWASEDIPRKSQIVTYD